MWWCRKVTVKRLRQRMRLRLPPSVPAGPMETADSADAFVDSTGVNVHLNFTDTPYGNFNAVETAIKNLGVRHIRDGLVDTAWTPYYDRLNELGRDGVKATLITSPSQTAALLTAYPSRVADSFEAYEAPNEYDQSGDANWSATMNAFLGTLSVCGQRESASVLVSDPGAVADPSGFLSEGGSFGRVGGRGQSAQLHGRTKSWDARVGSRRIRQHRVESGVDDGDVAREAGDHDGNGILQRSDDDRRHSGRRGGTISAENFSGSVAGRNQEDVYLRTRGRGEHVWPATGTDCCTPTSRRNLRTRR